MLSLTTHIIFSYQVDSYPVKVSWYTCTPSNHTQLEVPQLLLHQIDLQQVKYWRQLIRVRNLFFERFYYQPANSYQVGKAMMSTSSTDSLKTLQWYVIRAFQIVITLSEWLRSRSDHRLFWILWEMWGKHINVLPIPYLLICGWFGSRASYVYRQGAISLIL